jgi:hypothetical protein
MGFTERVRAWLMREGGEAGQLAAEAEQRIDADLTRRERELAATPEERLRLVQDEITEGDAELEAIRRRLDHERRDPGPSGTA